MERAQLGPPMVHMTKFDQSRLKDLGARRVVDRHTHTHTHTHRQTNAGNNKGNPSDRANRQTNAGNNYGNPSDRANKPVGDMGGRYILAY